MKFRTLIRRSLRFHWRSHMGVVLGAAIGSAALIGALVVGDSVKGSLRERALERLGPVRFALAPHDRLFRDELGHGLYAANNYAFSWQISSNVTADFIEPQPVTVLTLRGMASSANGEARANQVNILGVCLYVKGDKLGKWLGDLETVPAGEVWINQTLAGQLRARTGDELLLRTTKTSGLSSEAAIAPKAEAARALRLKITRILSARELGNFHLVPTAQPPMNAFVNLRQFQRELGLEDRANQVLMSGLKTTTYRRPAPFMVWWDDLRFRVASRVPSWLGNQVWRSLERRGVSMEQLESQRALSIAQQMLADGWKLEDAEAVFRSASNSPHLDLCSQRVFLDSPIVRAALAANSNAQPILTYLATLLGAGTNVTPYSMVTAAGAPWTLPDLRDDEIVVSQWLAEDLKVKPGDEIAMSYFLPESGARLEEATNTFRVHSIVPMEMPWADRTLMPDFPGIEKAESTSEWDAGFPLTYKVRPKDDEYWKQHRGTPKAFITLAAGQKLWGNRFGNLTTIRFPIPTNSQPTTFRSELERKILANLKPEELGLRFEPVREQALRAAEGSQDFGGLFLGFSFFVIAAALLLMAMLFRFGLEQRAPEIGTLLALGFTPKQVRNLFLREGAMLALFGGILGAIGGIYFAKAMLHGLATVWRDAVGATALGFHFTGQTVVIGVLASVIISTLTIWLALRKFVKRTARELLVSEIGSEESRAKSLRPKIIAVGALLTALTLVGWAMATGDTANTGIFFGGGALVLIAGLSFASAWLSTLACGPLSSSDGKRVTESQARGYALTLGLLGLRGCVRRRKRSLGTMAMLACGSFLIVSIGVFRLDANRDATQKTSGTGGFALIGETTMPVVQDLNSASGRDFFALNEADAQGVSVVPFRVRQGDEASCLNLNAAQNPRLLGVNPEILEGRFGFAKGDAWKALRESAAHINQKGDQSRPLERSHEIAAIGDANSIQWAMKKKVGDTIDYVDERGQPFKVRIVGAVANSILQGQLIIDESEFVKRFPGESGYRMFLIDTPSNKVSEVSATLSRAMQDVGLELTPTVIRLNQFNAVQNTYLGTFQVLGGLGLLLGSVGLGIVVLRNVLERRSELALLLAVGFRKAEVQRLLLMENGTLLLAGLGVGILAAAVAVLPSVLTPSGQLPYASLSITLAAVLCNGALWTWVATRIAVRGDLLTALRNE